MRLRFQNPHTELHTSLTFTPISSRHKSPAISFRSSCLFLNAVELVNFCPSVWPRKIQTQCQKARLYPRHITKQHTKHKTHKTMHVTPPNESHATRNMHNTYALKNRPFPVNTVTNTFSILATSYNKHAILK